MDFTPLYPVQRPPGRHHVQFSPGSTFILTLVDQTIIVRTAHDLGLVRCWALSGVDDPLIDRVAWSPDGSYILAVSTRSCMLKVFMLDPRRQSLIKDGYGPGSLTYHGYTLGAKGEGDADVDDVNLLARQDISCGAVAHIETSMAAGLSNVQWAPSSVPPTIFTFTSDGVGLTSAHCLADSSVTIFRDVKLRRHFPHPYDRSVFALLHRDTSTGQEGIGIYRYDDLTAQASTGSPSKPDGYAALLKDLTSSTAIAEPSSASARPALASCWRLEASFPCRTNDAATVSWSPDGSLIAVWEGLLEYKLLLFTTMGYLRGTFALPSLDAENDKIAPTESAIKSYYNLSGRQPVFRQTSGDRNSLKPKSNSEADAVALSSTVPGGLGIRTVSWQPRREAGVSLLAIGGYDEKIHLLGPYADDPEAGEWSTVGPPLDLSRRTFTSPLRVRKQQNASWDSQFRAQVWREPKGWIRLTGSRGIVSFLTDDDPEGNGGFPISIASLRPDWEKPSPSTGISWIEWDPSGRFLAARHDAMPSVLFVFVYLTRTGRMPASPLALLSVVLFAGSISCATWRPASAQGSSSTRQEGRATAQLAAITDSSAAVYLWNGRLDSGTVDVEGVPVPIRKGVMTDANSAEDFAPSMISYSSDGLKLALAGTGRAGATGAYCVAGVAPEDADGVKE